MSQQTAVDFLYEFVQLKLTHEQQMQFEGLFQQAKQMEKEQIIDAHLNGQAEFDKEEYRLEVIINAGKYYNETYGNKS